MLGELRSAPAGVLDAHARVVRTLDDDASVDDALRAVAGGLCALLRATRCSVYLRDPDGGTFRGRVAHAGGDIDAQVRRLVAGVEADGFTRDIVRTGAPVEIADARTDPRPVRSTMRAWGVRSMLGVPLLHGAETFALAFVDDEDDDRRQFGAADREAAHAFARLAAPLVRRTVLLAAERERLHVTARQNRVLRRAAALDETLTAAAARGVDGLVDALAEQTGRPVLVLDADGRRVAGADDVGLDPADTAPGGAADEHLRDDDAGARGGDGRVAAGAAGTRRGAAGPVRVAGPEGGRRHRLLVADVPTGDARPATLILAERGARLTALDRHAAQRAAALVGLALAAERRAVAAGHDSRAAFCSDLLRGDRDATWLTARARELDVDLHEPHAVCLVLTPDAAAARTAGPTPAAPASLAAAPLDGAVAHLVALPVGGDARRVARELLAATPGATLAVVSEPWTGAERAAEAFREVEATADCARGLVRDDGPRVLCTRDLGVGRLLLGDPSAAVAFAERALGPLLAEGTAPELLETVDAFLSGSRSVRVAAGTLGVHENTIRYRLARIGELTGLDVAAGSDDQLTAQLALRVLQLQGRCPWPDVGTEPERPALALVS